MARIYTKTGDDGTTGLIGGKRVSKDVIRIEAYGAVDELNAVLGLACAYALPESVRRILRRIQDDLFTVGANLALPAGTERSAYGIPMITEKHTHALELDIDACEKVLKPLRRFILPGGSIAGATLHIARTSARRAERRCVALARAEDVDPEIIRYLNRLSDLCFVLARSINREESLEEAHPTFGKGGGSAPDSARNPSGN